jgi:signal transduction histidine kinase
MKAEIVSDTSLKRLSKLAARIFFQKDEERQQIAVELHDGIGQNLAALRLNLALIETEDQGEEWEYQVQSAIQLVETTMDDLHTLTNLLRPPAIDAVGLNQAIGDCCKLAESNGGTLVTYQGTHEDTLPGFLQVIIYKLVREVLSELSKYGAAWHTNIRLEQDAEQAALSIQADPRTPEPEAKRCLNESCKLSCGTLIEEIELLGGEFHSDDGDGQALCLRVVIPIQEAL